MDTQKAFLVIGFTLLFVLLFNFAIYSMAKKRGAHPANQFEMYARVFKRARDPWEQDKEKLAELSTILAELQISRGEEEPKGDI
jgi:hypothetical protein